MDQLSILVLIVYLAASIQHRFEIKIKPKKVIFLKSQKNVNQIEEDDGKLMLGVNKNNKQFTFTLN